MLNHRYTGETDDQVYGARQGAELQPVELDPLSASRVEILRDAMRIIELLRAGEASQVPQEYIDHSFSQIASRVAEESGKSDVFDLSGLDSAHSAADMSEYLARLQA